MQEISARRNSEEENDIVGPKVPKDFLQNEEQEGDQGDPEKVELFGDSYKRPRR